MTIDRVQDLGSTIQYVATLGQTVFPVPFPFINTTDIVVQAGTVTLANGTAYTVSGAGNDTGGSITLAVGALANAIYTVTRDIAIERLTEYQQNGPFTSAAINAELDNIVLIEQQLEDQIGRAIRIPVTSTAPSAGLELNPANFAGAYLTMDANGNILPAVLSTTAITQAIIGGLLYPINAAETSIGVTPTRLSSPYYSAMRYGADPLGVTDSTVALQTAINCAQAAGAGRATAGISAANFKIGSAWTIDTNKTGLDLQGAFINATGFTTGNWCSITQSAADTNQRSMLNSAHPVGNFVVQGPGGANTTAYAMLISNTGATPQTMGVCVSQIGFQDWGHDVDMEGGANGIIFDNCTFGITVSGSPGTLAFPSIKIGPFNNSGERLVFRNCGWFKAAHKCYIQVGNGNCDVYVIGGSMDGMANAVTVTSNGRVFLIGTHVESPDDSAYWFSVSGALGSISLSHLEIIMDANKATWPMFYSDSSCIGGGIFLDDIVLASGGVSYTAKSQAGGVFGPVLIDGTGNAKVRGLVQSSLTSQPGTSAVLNLLAYPGFESGSYTAEWTLTNGAVRAATASSPTPHSGVDVLKFPGASGTSPQAVWTAPAKPGDYCQGSFWYQTSALAASGGTFAAGLAFLDKGGNSLVSVNQLTTTANVGSWTGVNLSSNSPAPPGTASVQLTFLMQSVGSGTPFAYVDDVLLTAV